MRIGIVVTTVGEKYALDSIRSFAEAKKPDQDLIAWYNCIDGFKEDFFRNLREITDDVIVCTKNKGVIEAYGFALLYLDYDYVAIACCDVQVQSNWFEKLHGALKSNEQAVGVPRIRLRRR